MSKKVKERRKLNRLKNQTLAQRMRNADVPLGDGVSASPPIINVANKVAKSNRGAFRCVLEYEIDEMARGACDDDMMDAMIALWTDDTCVMCGNFTCRCPNESAVPNTNGIRVRGSDGTYWISDEAMLDRSCVLCGYTGHGDCNCPATPFESWVRWRSLEAENR